MARACWAAAGSSGGWRTSPKHERGEDQAMATAQTVQLDVLYERDETAWLEAMADLIRTGRLDEVDYPNLAEYLADMARRDRREVDSRLVVLLAHVLKWVHQPDR